MSHKLNYDIVSSGSNGNCVIIEDVMIDCSVPYRNIEDRLYDIKYLLLTHIHSDHIKMPTLKSIKKKFPRIVIIGNYEIHMKYGVDLISNEGFEITTKDYVFTPFECYHDCKVHGYTWKCKEQSVIYATDTSTLEDAPDLIYDYMFLESNHDKFKLAKLAGREKGYDAYRGGLRHLSTQDSKAFYYMHRRDKHSKWIELHKSNRFY